MTQPVEERIDHEEAKRIAEILVRDIDAHRAWVPGPGEDKPSGLFFVHEDVEPVLRAYLALLTEHSAREHPLGCEACMVEIRKAVARGVTYLDNSMLCSDALPATESAQPEEER